MAKFKVVGGYELSGSITPQGAKNEALQIIAASVLVQNLKIVNCPNILDVRNLLLILENGGAKVGWVQPLPPTAPSPREGLGAAGPVLPLGKLLEEVKGSVSLNTLHIDTTNLNPEYFKSQEFFNLSEKLRGSLTLMGPLLARYGECYIPPVGGDKIGARPIDAHVQGFLSLGAKMISENGHDKLILDKNLKVNKEILLPECSVTGTANIIMAATYIASDLIIYNAACETYITQLLSLLQNVGLRVEGEMSNRIRLNSEVQTPSALQAPSPEEGLEAIGSSSLPWGGVGEGSAFGEEAVHTVLPDFIEVASFIALAMATRSEITIKNAGVMSLGMTLKMFDDLGCKYDIEGDDIKVLKLDKYAIKKMYNGNMININAEPWPRVSPDILSVGIVAALQADGVALFHDKMYEARMFFVDKLIAMGGQIVLCDPHRVVVTGNNWKSKMRARNMASPDIRAGVSLLIAALGAEGVSVIDNIDQIDRGYEDIDKRLATLGAKIERVD